MANIEKLQNPLKITEIADKINEIIEGGTGGSGLVFGSTIFSLIPLTEAGLHLLDGSLLNVGGIYDEAITKISALKSSNPNLFTTEENWQSSVSSHGVCGKFVYTEGVSLRLPKVTGFVEGTLDAGALGDLVEAGLPNITGTFFNSQERENVGLSFEPTGAFYRAAQAGNGVEGEMGWFETIGLDASLSNKLYGKSNTVQPQAIKGYLYIVLAITTKTNVQVNIDNVVTDLNNKVDKGSINEIVSRGLGYNQNWVNVTTKRVSGAIYTNTTGKPIFVVVTKANNNGWSTMEAYVNDVSVGRATGYYANVQGQTISFLVPNNSTYKVTSDGGFLLWSELR